MWLLEGLADPLIWMIVGLVASIPCAAICPDCPARSAVMFTSRQAHYVPTGGPYTTWTAAEAFHATRLDWIYTTNGWCLYMMLFRVVVVVAGWSCLQP